MKMNPYLVFKGNAREAFQFYEKVLGGKIEATMTFGEAPGMEAHTPPGWKDKIMHMWMTFDGNVLMASDASPEQFEPMQGMSVALHPETVEDAERLFKALSEGAKIIMELQETFWATRYGMLLDRFGTPWMINYSKTP